MSPIRKVLFTALGVALSGPLHLMGPTGASADTVYQPGGENWNGKIIYLSRACHDGNDDIPGGPCIPNYGCDDPNGNAYNENVESNAMANTTTFGTGAGWNLLERGYRVVIGDGTVSQNISNSNSRNINMHVPLHSNAREEGCGNTTNSEHGTWGLYRYQGQQRCARNLADAVGSYSPGTSDDIVYRINLGELNSVDAVTCYLEADFHTWKKGVNWLQDEVEWTHRIGLAVDLYFI